MNWIRCSHFTSSLIQSTSHGYATSARASWQDKPRPTSAYWKQKGGNSQKSTTKRRASTAAASEYNFKAIPLVPETLHKHLFSSEYLSTSAQVIAEDAEVDHITLPYLEGSDQEELLRRLEARCSQYVGEYQELLKKAASMDSLPPTPTSWVFAPGWTKYYEDGRHEPVENPDDKALFFDIEVCVEDGLLPTLAVAASESAWYSWCSDRLVNKSELPSLNRLTHLIPLEVDGGSQEERVVIGHNVAYDRARVREQYYPKQTGTKFWDTMSMSIPMFGMADHQLALYEKKSDIDDELESGNGWVSAWKERVSKNSLSAVHEKLCGGISNLNIDKSVRDVFIQGSIDDIRENFQKLVTYCAADVTATFEIYKAMFPKFQQRMPSPITWFGMFEMGSAYLPITKNWRDFYDHCEKSCDAKNNEAARGVVRSSRDLLEELRSNDDYKRDPWMWAVDWNVAARSALPMPKWYQGLFDTKEVGQLKLDDIAAANVKTRSREWPRIFGLCYGPYPLFYKKDYGWGFLVPPKDADEYCNLDSVQLYSRRKEYVSMPVKRIYDQILNNANTCMDVRVGKKALCSVGPFEFHRLPHPNGDGKNVGNPFVKDYSDLYSSRVLWANRFEDEMLHLLDDQSATRFWGNYRQRYKEQLTVWLDDEATKGAIAPTIVPAGTVTRRGVHKLFLTASNPKKGMIGTEIKSMIQCPEGWVFVGADVDSQEQWIAATLGDSAVGKGRAGATPFANMLLAGSKSDNSDLHSVIAKQVGISRNNAKVLNYARLYGSGVQHAVDFLKKEGILPLKARELSDKLFATTKGEAQSYSELKPNVVTYFENFLSTTDASDDAVIRLNGRYFLPDQSSYCQITSDFESWLLKKMQEAGDTSLNATDLLPHIYLKQKVNLFSGGFETDTFNYLETMLRNKELRTPILKCRLSTCLEPLPSDVCDHEDFRNKYRRSIINWVVQSSAVDFLHMLLLCMHWLIKEYRIDARYSISIHDEVRYVVDEKDKYRCALALHLSNMYVRAAISQHLGIKELPMSVAFFSQVDIDSVLRKEVTISVKNPDGELIPEGEALDFSEVLKRTGGKL